MFGLHRDTMSKMLAYSVPPGYRRRAHCGTRTLRQAQDEPNTGVIDRILDDGRQVPRKQRHTAESIYERLREEYGCTGRTPSSRTTSRSTATETKRCSSRCPTRRAHAARFRRGTGGGRGRSRRPTVAPMPTTSGSGNESRWPTISSNSSGWRQARLSTCGRWRRRHANRPRDAQSRGHRTPAVVKDRSRRQELGFAPNPTVECMLQGPQQDYNCCGQVRYA